MSVETEIRSLLEQRASGKVRTVRRSSVPLMQRR